MAALFARLTPDSRYQRFHSPKRELTARELTYFTDIDHLNHEAIAAVDQRDDSIIGVARYVRDAARGEAADMAIEVADAFHNMGIGTALTNRTIRLAQANGLTVLTAMTRWDNRAARRLLRLHGFRARHSRGGEIEYELKLSGALDVLSKRRVQLQLRHTSHPNLGGGARVAQATQEEIPPTTVPPRRTQ